MNELAEAREYLEKANRPGSPDVAIGHLINAVECILDYLDDRHDHTHVQSPSAVHTGGPIT